MKASRWGLIGLVAAVSVFALLLASGVTSAQTETTAKLIGTGYVRLTEEHVLDDGTLGAFVYTGSSNRKCLLTPAESSFALAGTTVYCGQRLHNDRPGIWIHVFPPQEPPADFVMTFTVYQQGARMYGRPIRSFGV
jgi:hypothetical protein